MSWKILWGHRCIDGPMAAILEWRNSPSRAEGLIMQCPYCGHVWPIDVIFDQVLKDVPAFPNVRYLGTTLFPGGFVPDRTIRTRVDPRSLNDCKELMSQVLFDEVT